MLEIGLAGRDRLLFASFCVGHDEILYVAGELVPEVPLSEAVQ
jgi:hypothetical protein